MEFDAFTVAWLIGGTALMLAEIVIPGGVVVFLGMGAVLVGLARVLGLLAEWTSAFTAWFVLSLALLIALRGLVNKILPGETSYQSPDEDLAAFGAVVDVIETVNATDSNGRIAFHGSSWPATSLQGTIPKGRKATISHRENLVWVVEAAEDLLLDDAVEKED